MASMQVASLQGFD